jgi:predicted transcriptional regulator
MPERPNLTPISLRLPAGVIGALDEIAIALERSRSWVVLRAIRQYLADEGHAILDIQEGIAEADRDEVVDFDDVMAGLDKIIADAKAKRAAE